MGQAAVFLDRDGTINVDKGYVHKIEDWEWLPGAAEAIRSINRLALPVIVVTNQAGIARGYYDEAAVHALHARVDSDLAKQGARIDAYYYCPHHPEYGSSRDCQCRKPRPGMLLQARDQLGLDLERSFMVGDKMSDMQAARAAGTYPIMVRTGYGLRESAAGTPGCPVFDALPAAVEFISANLQARSSA
jgi:D-glycero-D-manno-heptose 1,7-bisphosphate phosphatase